MTGNPNPQLQVLPRTVSVALSSATMQYSTAVPLLNATYDASAFLPQDNIQIQNIRPINPGGGLLDIGSYDVAAQASGNGLSNYTILWQLGTLTVVPLNVRFGFMDSALPNWQYGDTGPSWIAEWTNQQRLGFLTDAGLLAPVAPAFSTSLRSPTGLLTTLQEKSPVGTYTLTATLDPSIAHRYQVLNDAATLQISPRVISLVNPTGITATYGSRPTLSLNNVLAGDSVTALATNISNVANTSASIALANIWNADGTLRNPAAHEAPDVQQYSLNAVGLSGTSASNYLLSPASLANAELTIVPKLITATSLTGGTSVYGTARSAPTATFSGLVYAADAQSITPRMSLTATNVATGAGAVVAANTPVGSYSWALDSQTGQLSGDPAVARNYYLDLSAPSPASFFSITPRPVTYSVTSTQAIYGTPIGQSVNFDGLLAGDGPDLAAVLGFSSGGALQALSSIPYVGPGFAGPLNRAPAGTYDVSVNGLTGSAASNYLISAAGSTNGTLVVDPKELIWSTGSGVIYQGIGELGSIQSGNLGGYTLDGVLPGDSVTASLGATITRGTGTTSQQVLTSLDQLNNNVAVGDYPILVTAIGGASAPNYRLATAGNAPGILTVGTLQGYGLGLLGINVQNFLAAAAAGQRTVIPTAGVVALSPPPVTTQALGGGDTVNVGGSSGANPLVFATAGGRTTSTDGASASTTLGGITLSAGANQSSTALAGANATAGGVDASATARSSQSASACIGAACATARVTEQAQASARISPWSTTPVDLSTNLSVTVAAGARVNFTCGGENCSLAATDTSTVNASLGARIDWLSGVSASASAGASHSDTVSFASGCGRATCNVTGGVTFAVAVSQSEAVEWNNGARVRSNVSVGASVTASTSAGVNGSAGGVETSLGVSTGEFALGENASATMENGKVTLNVGATVGVGIVGVSFDVKIQVDPSYLVNGVNTSAEFMAAGLMGQNVTYTAFVDPAAAQARLAQQQSLAQDIAEHSRSEATYLQALLIGNTNTDPTTVQAALERLAASEQTLRRRVADAGFQINGSGSTLTLVDNNPPATTVVTEHRDGMFDVIAGAF